MQTELLISHGDLTKLATLCKCSTKYARHCLKGLYNTEKSELVRINAIKYFRAAKKR